MVDSAQERALRLPSIAVIGIGGTGCALLPLIASLGVAHITLMDGDTIEERNLVRQLLFTPADVGLPKVSAAALRLRRTGSAVDLHEEFRFIDASNCADLLCGHDVVADCTDDLLVRGLIDRTCANLGIPLVSGAVHGRQIQVVTRHVKGQASHGSHFAHGRPAEEQEGCDMQAVPAAVTTIAAALMAMRIEDLVAGGHGHSGILDLLDVEHGRWMRIMGPDMGEFIDTPISTPHHA